MPQELEPLTALDIAQARAKLENLKKKQAALREEEFAIRCYLADALIPEQEEGSKTFTFGDLKIKLERPVNRNITQAEVERFNQEHGEIALEVLRYKAEVAVKAYREHQEIADEYITTTFGTPVVEFKDVESKKK